MKSNAEQRLKASGIELPPPPKPLGAYVEAVQVGNLLFVSGALPLQGGVPKFLGRIGADLSIEDGRSAARLAALNALAPKTTAIEFTRLKALVEATDGNLGAHLETLEKAGYITIEKRFEGRKPQTRVRMSPTGRRAFADHVAYLRAILDGSGN